MIVGAGLTGAKAAETLREEGFTGQIVLIGEETERPYERPPLSKGYLLGDQERDAVHVHDAQWYDKNSVDLRLGQRVVGLDRAAHEVELDSGERIRYDKLLLATGASPRRLPIDGDVHYVRRLEDSDRLREALGSGGSVAIAGAGWIGLEIAAAARAKGCPVTVYEPAPTPLHAVLGPEIGGFFADLHRAEGVEFRFGESLPGKPNADVVVAGIGARPNTELAEAAGLTVEDGIVVDAGLRTSDPDIYAAGDVAAVPSTQYGRRLRVEHWGNAIAGGQAAAKSMLGNDISYDELPYFFSDQYDVGMEFTGWFAPGGYDRVVTRGDVAGRAFRAFWIADGRVVAGMHVNLWDEGLGRARELIHGGLPLDD
ncbi:3-phenylpropionate/trans-cinnamate dioxygenase ferredoxin reductase subunit [Allokutzneria albata]|uniref:3-phenylpropionate/trans-cinnamate dioxygenase ferredoxin reductase subunit n=1 Tax=Allokutzneria albata TaxID=211114 RepID=A0A1G9RZB8_ALLAB|nr:3-phenylpropionate/trans-cinnamate dioxygenase ferredoxin reductase subunit [Allokutzneria albata]